MDVRHTPPVCSTLVSLAELGVTTFAAAGNDSTERNVLSRGLCDQSPSPKGHVPTGVGCCAQPGRDGRVVLQRRPWVIAHEFGANVVSTAPVTIQGGLSAVAAIMDKHNRRIRSTIDPDRYSGGFATWSGTSFAAPTLAGRFLAES